MVITRLHMSVLALALLACAGAAAAQDVSPARAATLPSPTISELLKPDVAVPPTPRSGSEWQAQASALVAKAKLKHADELQEAATATAVLEGGPDAMTPIATSGLKVLNDPAAIVGNDWQADAQKRGAAALKANQADISVMAQKAPDAMQRSLDAVAKTLGMDSPTGVTAAQMQAQAAEHARPQVKYRLYLSQAMGDEAINKAMDIAKGHAGLQILFRGMKPGQTVYQLSQYLLHLFKTPPEAGDSVPSVVIDPIHFESDKVTVAPVLELIGDNDVPIAKVAGVVDPSWVDAQVAAGRTGDLGTMGPTTPIIEEDMLKLMQARAAKFDVPKWKQHAVDTFWDELPFVELPRAKEQRVFTVDPTVVVSKDIMAPNGQFIAHKGDRFNPLLSIGFHEKMLIFDVTDPEQFSYARAFLAANPNITVTLITTAVDRKDNWKGYRAVENGLRHAVYMLNTAIVSTWKLKAVPSIVEAKGTLFVITEVPVHQGGSHVIDITPQR